MKWQAKVGLILRSIVAMVAGAQSSTEDRGLAQETQVRGYWVDPSTGLMWAGKDNGKDVHWHAATKYCRNLRLAGYSDGRLATIDELRGIYDKSAEAPGENPQTHWHRAEAMTYQVKGNVFLTGMQWSITQRTDDRGRPSGLAWYFDFINGRQNDDDASFMGSSLGRRALCVRRSGEGWGSFDPVVWRVSVLAGSGRITG